MFAEFFSVFFSSFGYAFFFQERASFSAIVSRTSPTRKQSRTHRSCYSVADQNNRSCPEDQPILFGIKKCAKQKADNENVVSLKATNVNIISETFFIAYKQTNWLYSVLYPNARTFCLTPSLTFLTVSCEYQIVRLKFAQKNLLVIFCRFL